MAAKLPDYEVIGQPSAVAPKPDNMTNRLYNMGPGSGDQFNSSTVCQESDFLSTYVFKPAIEATFRKFLEVCTPEVNVILPDTWTLCTTDGNFSCDAIAKYASGCKHSRFGGNDFPTTTASTQNSTTSGPCTMGHVIQDDSATILLLVGLVFIGMLVGVALTVAVCVICPGLHRWTMSKIKGDMCKDKKVVRASTVSSEYYAAIEDSSTNNPVRLRPVQKMSFPVSDRDYQLQDAKTSPHTPPVGYTDFNDPVYQDNGISGEPIYTDTSGATCYEHLSRNNPHGQSHKYASIGVPGSAKPPDPESPELEEEPEEHNYVTLEKTT